MKAIKKKFTRMNFAFVVCLLVLLVLQLIWTIGAITANRKQNEGKIVLALNSFAIEYNRLSNSQKVIGNDPTSMQLNTRLIDSLLDLYLVDRNKLTVKYSYQILPNKADSQGAVPGAYVGKYVIPLKVVLHGAMSSNDGYQLHFRYEEQAWYEMKEHQLWFFIVTSFLFICFTILGFIRMFSLAFRLQRLAEAQADFIYNITHELKTPVATIAMSCKTLKQAGTTLTDLDKISRYAAIIDEENKRVGECVSSLLDTLTVKKETLTLNKEMVNLNELVESAAEAFRISKSAPIAVQLANPLPLVSADKMHMRSVIDNLIDNAIKYSRPDSIHITIGTQAVEGGVEITVEDKGKGIASKDLKLIFEKFYRASRSINQGVKGFGLGLYYVKQVIDAHEGGEVAVTSSLGKGTKVKIFLPTHQQKSPKN